MATVKGSGSVSNQGHVAHRWTALANGDDGAPAGGRLSGDRSVQVDGTFGAGGTIVIEGSNDSGVTWSTLNDPQGSPLSFTGAGLKAILEYVEQIRPRVTAGDGTTSLDADLIARKPI